MSDHPGYLYAFAVNVSSDSGVSDAYRQPIGIRTVKVTGTQFLINGKPFYFHGFGKHEDANVRRERERERERIPLHTAQRRSNIGISIKK